MKSLSQTLKRFVWPAVAGVVLGLGVAWAQEAFGLSRRIVYLFWGVLSAAALAAGAFAYVALYKAVRDDEWDGWPDEVPADGDDSGRGATER